MKNSYFFVLSCLLVIVAGTTKAQESEYYRVGDTINGRSPIYYYQWWSEEWLADTSHRLNATTAVQYLNTSYIGFHGELLQYYYTDTPLKLIGIASSSIARSYGIIPESYTDPLYPEYIRLYDASVDTFELIKEIRYFRRPDSRRYMNLDIRAHNQALLDENSKCCYWPCPDTVRTVALQEYYFDKPITVTDSFYLGYTIENNYGWTYDVQRETIDVNRVTICPYSLMWDEERISPRTVPCDYSCENMPNQLFKYRDVVWDCYITSPTYGDTIDSLSTWRWSEDPYYMVQFPIIVIDSLYIAPSYECPPVTNLRIADIVDGRVVLYWDTHPDHNSWQTCFGPQGTPPDSCTVINCPIQVGVIDNLDTNVHYDAYVRGICLHDSTCYSEWVGPIDIFISDTTTSGGSGGGDSASIATTLNLLTSIVPNPATMQATVYSSFMISHVSILNGNGQTVMARTASGNAVHLDLKNLSSGLYIVVVKTAAGNVAKKLIVK